MRDSIAGAWLYSIVLVFIVLLVGFIAISINYNKAYKLKTTVVNLIEQNQGINDRTLKLIDGYLDNNGYINGKRCSNLYKDGQKYMGINKGVSTGVLTKGKDDKNVESQQLCVTREEYISNLPDATNIEYYYDVYMFFSFSLPVFGDIFKFNVVGTTNPILYPQDTYPW